MGGGAESLTEESRKAALGNLGQEIKNLGPSSAMQAIVGNNNIMNK